MDREILIKQVTFLRQQGMSIRAIASDLAVSKSRVERALNSLAQTDESAVSPVALAELTVPPFVGRLPEIESLRTALGFAMSGRGQMAMLAGEPGIGKTRISRELSDGSEREGVQTLWGWCYEDEGAPPFWPWIQAIRAYVGGADASTLEAEMGAGAADIAALLPEIHNKLPGLAPLPVLSPEL
jgi:hypothetical protein